MDTKSRLSSFLYSLTVLGVFAAGLFTWWFFLHP